MLPYFRIEVILFIAGLCLFLALFDKLLNCGFYLYNRVNYDLKIVFVQHGKEFT